jgi:hypothetical protein
MKKIIIYLVTLITFSVLTSSVFGQEKKMDSKMGKMNGKMKDCVMMKDGKMMVEKGGKTMDMDKSMTMSNGSVVMPDGSVKMKNGTTKMLKDGDCVYMNGKMTSMKMHTTMHKKTTPKKT